MCPAGARNPHRARRDSRVLNAFGSRFLRESQLKFLTTRIVAGSILAGLTMPSASASGVSPYLPLHISPEIERQIERVLILAGKSVMTRPIAAATVVDALPAACELDGVLCQRVQRYIERYTDTLAVSDASAEAAASSGDSAISLPNARGMPSDSAWQVAAHAYWQPSPYAILSVGGIAYDGDSSPAGSILSVGFEFAQLDVGYREHWLSPFTQHAMLISTQAPTLPSITLSNYSPITRLGFRYQIFMVEMEHTDRILVPGDFTSGRPSLAGLHLAIEPAVGWSLAANRLAQFGGGGRGKSFGDFIDALWDPEEFDERGNISLEQEFGNQLAAWTSRFIFPGPTPFSVYLEYAGEDRAYEGNYRSFSNAALSLGIDFPALFDRFDLTYETSEWQNSWYVHSIYRDGLTNEGHVLGHWGGDARLRGHGIGGQSHMLRIGWEPRFGGLLQFRARTLANEKYPLRSPPVPYERAYDLTVGYSRSLRGFTAGAELMAGRDVFGDSFSRLEGFVRFGDEWTSGGGTWVESASRPEGAELFVDAGLNANRVLITLDAVSATRSGVRTDTEFAPHLALGARRAVSGHNDLGVRIEVDRINEHTLIGLRALDYRYRFDGPLALSAFVGAARYDLATPALGYYGGVGAQWRDILPGFDLGIDAKYADKVTRDKLLPGEPTNVRPDSFYDISSVSLYLSYKW